MRKSNWLLEYQKDGVQSQHAEDGMLRKIFEVISPFNKWCVEFGAWDGKSMSNTWFLIKSMGWSGVEIEANPNYFESLQTTYANNNVTCLNTRVEFEGENTLDRLLAKTDTPITFDLLSIDIDGYDYQIWASLRFYRPTVVVIEYNGLYGYEDHIQRVPAVTGQGSSLSSITALAKSKGYELIATCGRTLGVNAFYVRDDLFAEFEIEDNSISKFITEDGMLIR